MTRQAPRTKVGAPQVSIRFLRLAFGVEVRELCDRITEQGYLGRGGKPVNEDTIRNIELGWKRPSNALLVAWAKALGMSPLDVTLPGTPLTVATDDADESSAA